MTSEFLSRASQNPSGLLKWSDRLNDLQRTRTSVTIFFLDGSKVGPVQIVEVFEDYMEIVTLENRTLYVHNAQVWMMGTNYG